MFSKAYNTEIVTAYSQPDGFNRYIDDIMAEVNGSGKVYVCSVCGFEYDGESMIYAAFVKVQLYTKMSAFYSM